MVSIKIVADCGLPFYQITRKLMRATSVEFTIESANIFTHFVRVFVQFILTDLSILSHP